MPVDPEHRLFRPDLGGGALLDLGIVRSSCAPWCSPRRLPRRQRDAVRDRRGAPLSPVLREAHLSPRSRGFGRVQGQLCPDGLAGAGVARAPTATELRHEQQTAASLIVGTGAAQVGAVLLASETSQMRLRPWIRRNSMGGSACRIAFVTSSLTTSSVTKDASCTFHAPSCAVTSLRALATTAGSAGRSQVATCWGLGAGDEQGDVVGGVLGWHGGEDGVTKIVQGRRGTGEGTAQTGGPLVDVLLSGLDQPVGVESEQASLGEGDLGGFEGQSAQTQRWTGRYVQEVHGACTPYHGGDRVARTGQRADAGDRVVDRVQARDAEAGSHLGGLVAGRGAVCVRVRVRCEPDHQVVEVGEQFVGRKVDVGEGSDGGP